MLNRSQPLTSSSSTERDVAYVRYEPTKGEQQAFQTFKTALYLYRKQQQAGEDEEEKKQEGKPARQTKARTTEDVGLFMEERRKPTVKQTDDKRKVLDEKEVMTRYPPVALLRFQPVKSSTLSTSAGSSNEAATTTNDIFVHFPPEICIEILEYLSAKDLSVASLVSRTWHYWTSFDKLWQSHCGNSKYEPQRKLANQTWKELYYELQVEQKRKQMRREVAEWNQRHWQCRAACGIGEWDQERVLRRPRPGSELERFVPIVGFKVHPNSSNDLTLDFQFNIQAAAKELVAFLQDYASTGNQICSNAEEVKIAMWRYERFMRLQGKYADQLLIPTVEIELIWQSHLVRPTAYLKDIYDVFGVSMIEHRLIGTNMDKLLKEEALKQTAKLWKDEYGEEYTNLPTGQLHPKTPYFVDGGLSCRVEEVGVQNMYYNPGSRPEAKVGEDWTNPFRLTVEDVLKDLEWYKYFTNSCFGSEYAHVTRSFIVKSAKAYERFLYLAAKCPSATKDGGMMHPTYAIDLIWHTHMLHPQHYRHDCMRWVGRMVEHVPWPDHYEENNFTETNKHWKDEFGVNIEEEHKLAAWAVNDSDEDSVWEGWGS